MAAPEAVAPGVGAVLAHPSATSACKSVLRERLERHPVDAARDAEVLSRVLGARCDELLGRAA
ncbi:MAG TPA: hypothetical protein VF699_07590 [Caulobacteraceae bacterium]|jgi:hypothetical protein